MAVLAVRNGHGVSNTASVLGAPATLGVSLLDGKSEAWRCPDCGGRATRQGVSIKEEWVVGLATGRLMLSLVIGIVAHSAIVGLIVLLLPLLGTATARCL